MLHVKLHQTSVLGRGTHPCNIPLTTVVALVQAHGPCDCASINITKLNTDLSTKQPTPEIFDSPGMLLCTKMQYVLACFSLQVHAPSCVCFLSPFARLLNADVHIFLRTAVLIRASVGSYQDHIFRSFDFCFPCALSASFADSLCGFVFPESSAEPLHSEHSTASKLLFSQPQAQSPQSLQC